VPLEYIRGLQTIVSDAEKPGTTMSTIWNLRDHIKYVQNLMAGILDSIESIKNMLNWTAPTITKPIYLAVVVIWIATVLIPGRLLILARKCREYCREHSSQ